MGCYYLTAARGEEGEKVEAGDGMVFPSPAEVFLAYSARQARRARPHPRPPADREEGHHRSHGSRRTRRVVEELPRKPNGLVSTTVGRVIFNDILHPKMAFYDLPLSRKHLSRIIADCYQLLGRRETIDLLDRMKETGFRESTRTGLSLRHRRPAHAGQQGSASSRRRTRKSRSSASSTSAASSPSTERYNKVIDLWTRRPRRDHQADDDTTSQHDRRERQVPYLNPIFLMAHSGARGGVEQIRQLAGMRGLMAKPSRRRSSRRRSRPTSAKA